MPSHFAAKMPASVRVEAQGQPKTAQRLFDKIKHVTGFEGEHDLPAENEFRALVHDREHPRSSHFGHLPVEVQVCIHFPFIDTPAIARAFGDLAVTVAG
jgi:hypothetical protein